MFDTCTLGEQEDGGLAQVPSHSLEFQWVLLEFLLWGFLGFCWGFTLAAAT